MDRVEVMELVQAYQVHRITQREFTQRAAVALGSTRAVDQVLAACAISPKPARPVLEAPSSAAAAPAAAPISPGSAGAIAYPNSDGRPLLGYLARPQGDSRRPAVIVIQEWWGLNDNIKSIARRFADAGYVALAPDLYHGVAVSEPDEARKLVMELDREAAVREIQQAITFLLQQEYVAGRSVGIVGFCMGGRLVLLTSLVDARVGAAVPFYGSTLTSEESSQVKAPLQGHYGAEDGGIPVAGVRAMEQAVAAAGAPVEMYVYDGAGHAFFNDTRAAYDAAAAQLAWDRTLTWFRKYLAQA